MNLQNTLILIAFLLIIAGCVENKNLETTTSTTSPAAIIQVPATSINIEPSIKAIAQKGLDSTTVRNRGFYRDEEFIIIGVLQNPYTYPASARINYTLYDEFNTIIASGTSKDEDIINGYTPAKGIIPFKISCGKIPNVAKYKINLDLQQTTAKSSAKYKEINATATINENIVSIGGLINNTGLSNSKNTKIIAMLYDVNDKAIDALSAYTLPIDIPANTTASFTIQNTYPKTYSEYLKKIDYYRLFIQETYAPEIINTTTIKPKIPIVISGANNTEIKIT